MKISWPVMITAFYCSHPWEVPSHRYQGGSVRTLEYRGHTGMLLQDYVIKDTVAFTVVSLVSIETLQRSQWLCDEVLWVPHLRSPVKLQPWPMSWLPPHETLWIRASQLTHFQNPDPTDWDACVLFEFTKFEGNLLQSNS